MCHDLSRTYLNNNAKLGASLSALVSEPLIATTCMYGREESEGNKERGRERVRERERKRKRESQWF